MKKVLALVLALVLCLAFTGAMAEGKEKLVIGFAINESDSSMNLQREYFIKACEDFNASSEKYEIEYHITSAEADVQKQLDDVNTLIEMGCKAICMHSVDTEGCKAAVDACNAAGVYMVEARGMDYDGIDLRFNPNDEAAIAAAGVAWFDENVMNNPDTVLKIGAIYGLATQTAQLVRVDKVISTLQEKYGEDRVILVDKAYCDWDTQKGMEIMENWLQKYSLDEMNCILNASGSGMVGAVQAIVGFGGEELCDKYLLQTTDANADVCYYVNNGMIDMTIGLSPVQCGKITAEVLVQALTGEPGVNNFDLSSGKLYLGAETGGIVCIDSTNIAEWYDADANEVTYPE